MHRNGRIQVEVPTETSTLILGKDIKEMYDNSALSDTSASAASPEQYTWFVLTCLVEHRKAGPKKVVLYEKLVSAVCIRGIEPVKAVMEASTPAEDFSPAGKIALLP